MNLTNIALPAIFPLAQAEGEAVQTETVTTTAEPGDSSAKPASQPAPGWAAGPWIPMILILLMAWLFIFRPKSKQEKERVNMLNSLKKGDRIQTIGGILGTVVHVRDDEVVVKVDETSNTKITFSRNAIHRVREQEKK